jgi:putative ATPase
MSLFTQKPEEEKVDGSRPLAERMRPRDLEEFAGQEHLLGEGMPLRVQIERDDLRSLIFWGPPGVGKTTLAKIIARRTHAEFIEFSAVLCGIKEIKTVMAEAGHARQYGQRTIVFIDEIHRFNKAQQDAFLPHVERGDITLIGATTENPSFEIISALLSRSRVYVMNALTPEEIAGLIRRALADEERGLGLFHLTVDDGAMDRLTAYASGDARTAYNALDVSATLAVEAAKGASGGVITAGIVENALQKKMLRYDKAGEEHYNLISALHKSVRNSDPDAALYWLARMIESGEDGMYLARRLVRMAIEDISLADPHAMQMAIAARDAYDFLGFPEGNLALAQVAVYLAIAPKSNALYKAYGTVKRDVAETVSDPVPLHLRNAPTRLMKEIGYGDGYQYAHDLEEKVADMQCLPDNLQDRTYYHPTAEGVEKRIQERMAQIARLKSGRRKRAQEAESSKSPEE